MLYTDKFLFLHIPKTGGTFARIAIRNALTSNALDLALHRIAFAKNLTPFLRIKLPAYPYKYREIGSQHCFWKSVPDVLRSLTVISIVRDPLLWAYSHFKFGVIRDKLVASRGTEISDFDHFLDVWDKFGTFVDHSQNEGRVGNLSSEFICFFLDVDDRPKVFGEYPNVDAMCQAMRYYMPPVRFLRNETLNDDLSSVLEELGYPKKMCREVKKHQKVNVSRGTSSMIGSHAKGRVLEREAFLYRMFPHYLPSG